MKSPRRYSIRVCRGPECGERHGSQRVYEAFRRTIEARGLGDRCELGWQSCFGRCSQGPNVLVRDVTPTDPDAPPPPRATALYNGFDVVNVEEVVEQHLERGVVVSTLVLRPSPLGVRS